MTRNILHIFLFSLLTALASCSDDSAPNNQVPVLQALDATEVSYYDATLHGQITTDGSGAMPHLRFIYGETAAMGRGESTKSDELTPVNGKVALKLTGLSSGTSYSYLLLADNGRVQQQSNTASFNTLTKERPTTGNATILSQGPTSLIIGFYISEDGGEPLLEGGCTLKAAHSEGEQRISASSTLATGTLIKVFARNLTPTETYTITPFARNKVGETTGETLTVTLGNTIMTDEPGSLPDLLDDRLYTMKGITISGPLNGTDIRALRSLAGRDYEGHATATQIEEIDITDATIKSGGESFSPSCFTKEKTVSQGMFASLGNLKSLKLPNDITTVERDAMKDCSAMTALTLPAMAESVQPSDGCSSLKAINVSPANSHFSSHDGVLFDANATTLLWLPLAKSGAFTVPSTVTSIGSYAFKGSSIEQLTLPASITAIGQAAFADSKIASLRLPDGLTSISSSLLQGCTNLRTLYIGSKAEIIGNYVFSGCPLTDIYISAAIPPVCSSNTFTSDGKDIRNSCALHVPSSSFLTYINHSYWSKFNNILEY